MRARIRSGKWPAGTPLPSRRELAKEYDVAGVTVERAIACLTEDGTLCVKPRKGTFVAETGVPVAVEMAVGGAHVPENGKARRLGILAELPAYGSLLTNGSYFETRIAVQAIESVFSSRGLPTRFINLVERDGVRLPIGEAVNALVQDGVDGIAMAFNDEPEKARQAFAASRRHGIPLVYVSSRELDAPLPHVFFDNRDAGFQAGQHLLGQGCRSVMLISPFTEDWTIDRGRGLRDAYLAAEMPGQLLSFWPPQPAPAPWGSGVGYDENKRITHAAAFECAQTLFRSGAAPDGIVAANDHIAFAVIEAATENGLRAGDDFLLLGFDDVPDARIVNLSTLRPPLENMGHEAANMLLEAVNGRLERQQVKLRSRLVTRGSTNRLAAGAQRAQAPKDRDLLCI